MGTPHTWADAPDPLALSCLLSSPAPSVGGGLCRDDWLMGAQAGDEQGGGHGARSRGTRGRTPIVPSSVLMGWRGTSALLPRGPFPGGSPADKAGSRRWGEAWGPGSPSRGKAATGQGLGGPRAGLPRGHDASRSQALQTTPPTLAILEGGAGRAAGSVSGGPRSPTPGDGARALPLPSGSHSKVS